MKKDARIYVAGHRGLVGSAILRRLREEGYASLLTRSRGELDLKRQADVEAFFAAEKPEYVFLAAARVGGILANNTYPADFIFENLMIQMNVIHSSWKNDVKRLLFLGSSCIYPKFAPQPMKEEHLLTGILEPTNEPYAIAKIAGIKTCESYNRQHGTRFLPVMPTNLYGPNDNFDLQDSHVLPAMIRKFHDAKLARAEHVVVWGTGTPLREFLYVDDLAEACVFVMNLPDETVSSIFLSYPSPSFVNIGAGEEIAIRELAETVRDVVGFEGGIVFDATKPDGTPRKLLDSSRIRDLGWLPRTTLREGIKRAYAWYLEDLLRKSRG